LDRDTFSHIEPLDAANGKRRFALDNHQRNDAQSPSQCSRDLVQAVAVRPPNRVRREQEHDRTIHLVRSQVFESLLNKGFPVVTGRKPLLVEPDLVTTAPQVVTQTQSERDVFVMAIAQKETLGDERLIRHELVPTVFAVVPRVLLAEASILGTAVGAQDVFSHCLVSET